MSNYSSIPKKVITGRLRKAALFWAPWCLALVSCSQPQSPHQKMVKTLSELRVKLQGPGNEYSPLSKLAFLDSIVAGNPGDAGVLQFYHFAKASILLEMGEENEAIGLLESLVSDDPLYKKDKAWKSLAMAYLRLGERSNCIHSHAAESCIIPMKGMGIHEFPRGSENAIRIYEKLLESDSADLESKWLLNLAHMTLGWYPEKVPPAYFVPGIEGDTSVKLKPFTDIAGALKLDVHNMSGGSIVEDFNNDGYLDLFTSAWGLDDELHFFRNNGDGTFSDESARTGLKGITGGLNMLQADYNNDGYQDILILRGAWKRESGLEPNSLIRNNGDGTFTDVTISSGLLSFHPTQTATWNDFNNDGWLDLFIGNESKRSDPQHPCQLYINNGDGTFREVGKLAHCAFAGYVKGVASGDYDNDGWMDIFISSLEGGRKLLRNKGLSGQEIAFEDVSVRSGIGMIAGRSFPAWFWDYDNDGWLDIYTCDYSFQESLATYAAAEHLGIEAGSPNKMYLFRNNRRGGFTNVAKSVGLHKNAFAMGANFGDINNDGFLDMYLGTGNPDYKSLVSNKMFISIGGESFADVTASARVGHVQKGHGVSFADLDNDGDQDIYIQMGGAFPGDAYRNALFLNPGQNNNNWICLQLEGTVSNRSAVGSRVKITCRENGVVRSIYRDVNSGGSFGASPLRREIGIGTAEIIDEIEIRWHGSGLVQTYRNIEPNQFLKITEGSDEVIPVALTSTDWNPLCVTPPISSVTRQAGE